MARDTRPSPLFPAHGQVQVHVDGRVLRSDFIGPWNVELVALWGSIAWPLTKQLDASGWYAGVVTVKKSMICTNEALVALEQGVKTTFRRFRCAANVIVVEPGVEGRELMKPFFVKMHEGVGPFCYAATLAEGTAFALKHLAEAASRPC